MKTLFLIIPIILHICAISRPLEIKSNKFNGECLEGFEIIKKILIKDKYFLKIKLGCLTCRLHIFNYVFTLTKGLITLASSAKGTEHLCKM